MNDFSTDASSIFVIIPAKDEERFIDLLFKELTQLGFKNIVLVNDSSVDRTRAIAEDRPNVTVLDHVINLGAGAATQTGIAYAVEKNAEIILTIDADLQHNPKNLIDLVRAMESDGADLVIGSRFNQKNNIPKSRIFFNKVGNIISWVLTGKYLSDSQSGLKAISKKLAQKLDMSYDGFEFCMEIIKVANSTNSKIIEIPIDVIYTAETMEKGQGLASGFKMIARIFSPFN